MGAGSFLMSGGLDGPGVAGLLASGTALAPDAGDFWRLGSILSLDRDLSVFGLA